MGFSVGSALARGQRLLRDLAVVLQHAVRETVIVVWVRFQLLARPDEFHVPKRLFLLLLNC